MLRFLIVAVGLGWLLAGASRAQTLPPGYQGVIQITSDAVWNWWPSINNRGQIAFAKSLDPYNVQTTEIYLWDNGALTRLTDDNVWDDYPDINDAGELVWSREIGAAGTFEIVLWRQGQLTRLTYDDLDDYAGAINNQGWIAWDKMTEQGCEASDADIYLYDGQAIRRITDGGYSNQTAYLNDLGDIAWTRYNFCTQPWWTSDIMLYSGGVITKLTTDQYEPRVGDVNNDRLVGWFCAQQYPPDYIELWQSGVTWLLTNWGSGLRMNNRGDIVFNRWHEDTHTWQVWLYRAGQFWQITKDPFWNRSGALNDYGDMAWVSGPSFAMDIRLLKRFPVGDLNCDGFVNAFDIDPFVLALTDPPTYASVYPHCDYILADINLDSQVNAFDIDPFVDLLTK